MMNKTARISIIVNPFSGNGRGESVFNSLKLAVQKKGALKENVVYIERSRPKTETGPYEKVFKGSDIVVIAGGDGAFHHAVNMAKKLSFNGKLGIFPIGTGNDFAAAVGSFPSDIVKYLKKIIDEPQQMEVDVFSLNKNLYFVSFASFGGDAWALAMYEKLCDRLYGSVLYRIPYIKYLLYSWPALSTILFYRDTVREAGDPEPCAAIIVNSLKTYGGGSVFDKNSSISDGKIEIVRFATKFDYLKFLLTRTKLYRPAHATRTMKPPFDLQFDSDVPVQVAGEDYTDFFKGCRKFTIAHEETIKVCV